jgi:dipeptidyl aminopeptidase/acylaminoacyl peptidase
MVSILRSSTGRARLRRAGLACVCSGLLAQLAPGIAMGAPSLGDLTELSDIDSLSVSPDGQYLVFRTVRGDIARNSYDLAWYSIALKSGAVRSIGSGGEPVYTDPGIIAGESPLWDRDSRFLIFRARLDGAIGVWRASPDGLAMTPLIVRDEDIEDLELGEDGRSLSYKVGPSRNRIEAAEDREYDDGIRVDSSVDLAQNLYRGGWVDGRKATQRLVGYWFVRAGLLWRWPRQQRRYDLETGTDQPIGPPAPVPDFQPPSVTAAASARSPGGKVAEAGWNGQSGFVTATLNGAGATARCDAPACASERVSALAWRPGSSQLLITFTDRFRRQSLSLWDAGSGAFRELTTGEGLLSGSRRSSTPCAVGRETVYCVAASAASPPRLEGIDLETGRRSVLFDPNPSWRGDYRPAVDYLRWRIPGGAIATGVLLTGSAARTQAPLFVNYYSCDGFLRGGEGDEWPLPQLIQSGFAVACVNAVPFSGPQDAVNTYKTGLEAVRSLIDSLARRAIADRSRVAMGGLSFGSEVAAWVASRSSLLAALSLASGQSDPTGYWFDSIGRGDRPDKIRQVWGLGRPDKTASRWKLISAALNAERIKVPTLLQLPEQEARRIPEFTARLQQSGTPAELYAYPDEGHIKLQPRHRLSVYRRNLDWFRYWLQDYRDPDPSSAAQYARWDSLRARRLAAGSAP